MQSTHSLPIRALSWPLLAAASLVVCVATSGLTLAQEPDETPGDQAREAFREALQRVMIPSTFLTDGPQVRAAFREVISETSKATVRIEGNGKKAALGGIIGPDGWILTKASQLKEPITCKLSDGRELPAELIGVDRAYDLAVLKVDAKNLPVVTLKRDDDSEVGEWVATLAPGRDPIAVGVVSVDTRQIRHEKGTLGVQLEQVPEGPRVVQVFRDTAAAEAGILVNDLIVAVNGKPTPTHQQLIRAIAKYSPGDSVEMDIRRGDTKLALRAVLTGRVPAMAGTDRREYQNSLGSELSDRRFGFPKAFQHDTVLSPLDCGGPLVDLEGRVVGFNIARSGRTESYAIPSNVVITRLYDLMSGNLAVNAGEEEEDTEVVSATDKTAQSPDSEEDEATDEPESTPESDSPGDDD